MTIREADRLASINEYYFSQKLEQIQKLNASGRDIVNLGIGSPDLPPRGEVIEAAEKALRSSQSHGYSSYRSTVELRRAFGQWYQHQYDVRLDSEREVLPLLGSKEGLFYIAMAFLNPGDKALIPNPGYPAYASATTLAGAQGMTYDLTPEKNWWPDFAALEKMNLDRVKLMWVNYPHMPTGASGSVSLFQELVKFGRRHRILICHDNPYGLVLNRDKPMSLLAYDTIQPRFDYALELNSLSKSFHMAGWRVGALIANAQTVDSVLKVKSNVDSGMFLPIQRGATEALLSSDSWRDEQNKIYSERRQWAERIFDQMGFKYSRDQVGLFLWAEAPREIRDVSGYLDEVLNTAGVFMTPGIIFGSQGSRYARCSLCAPTERLKEALRRLEKQQ